MISTEVFDTTCKIKWYNFFGLTLSHTQMLFIVFLVNLYHLDLIPHLQGQKPQYLASERLSSSPFLGRGPVWAGVYKRLMVKVSSSCFLFPSIKPVVKNLAWFVYCCFIWHCNTRILLSNCAVTCPSRQMFY